MTVTSDIDRVTGFIVRVVDNQLITNQTSLEAVSLREYPIPEQVAIIIAGIAFNFAPQNSNGLRSTEYRISIRGLKPTAVQIL